MNSGVAEFSAFCTAIDEAAMKFASGWHRLPAPAAALEYRGINLGYLCEKDFVYHFVGALKRLVPDAAKADGTDEGQRLAATTGRRKASAFFRTALQNTLRPIFNAAVKAARGQEALKVLVSSDIRHVRPVIDSLAREHSAGVLYLRESFGPRQLRDFWANKVQFLLEEDFNGPALQLPSMDLTRIEAELERYFTFRGGNFWPAVREKMLGFFHNDRMRLARRVDAFYALFSRHRISAVLMDEDICEFNKTLASVARQMGIYSLVVQHGIPAQKVGFYPLTADEMAVWGDWMKERMMRWGIPGERLPVEGAPQYDRFFQAAGQDAEKIKKESFRALGLDDALPTVLLATQPLHEASRPELAGINHSRRLNAELVRAAAALLRKDARLQLIIKLHPRDLEAALTQALINEFAPLKDRIRMVQHVDPRRLLPCCDVLVTTWSTIFVEAAIFDKPVILVDPLQDAKFLPPEGGGPLFFAKNAEEMCRHLMDCLRSRPASRRAFFLKNLLFSPGGAADRVADRIVQKCVR